MSDNIDQVSFSLFWDGVMKQDENHDENQVQTVKEMSFEEFFSIYGFDPQQFDQELTATDNTATDTTATVSVPSSNSDMSFQNPESARPTIEKVENEPQNTSEILEFDKMNTSDVKSFIESQANKSTLKKTVNDLRKFERFLQSKGETRPLHSIPVDLLDEYVANFILSCRTKEGTEYEPSSIRNIIGSLDRELAKHKYPYSIMNSKGPEFNLSRQAFSAKKKSLKKQGRGNKPRAAEPLSDQDIELFYTKGILGDHTPQALLNVLWLNNCIHFGLRGTTEQYNLR